MAVTQDDLERALRETLSRRVATPRPLAADPAGVAIRRARRAQRRRTLTGLALAGVTTVLVTAGMAQLGGQPGRPTTPTVVLGDPQGVATTSAWPVVPPPPARPVEGAVDLIVGSALVTADAKRYDLGVGPADRAQRLPDGGGWLVVGRPTAAKRSLWAVPAGGPPQVLLAGAEEVVLSPDGRQVAWRDGDQIFAGGIIANQIIATVGVTAPAGAVPARFVGDRVLVRGGPRSGGYLLWRPSAGALPTGGDRDVRDVYGVLPDGRLAGRVTVGGRSCLALLDSDLTPVRTGCGPTPAADGLGAVSADGRWLLVNGRAGARDGALLVDLTTLDAAVPDRPVGPTITGEVAWTGSAGAAYADRGGALAQLRPDRVLAGGSAASTLVSGLAAGDRPVVVTGPPDRAGRPSTR
ncbi:hypothetical protein [Micromonospora psammae]|uniref:hypothetical protein n=1 Tax=Micromonospora sp. CPCC 205556 TaxID=3122398 RepID=UPI002FF0736F